MFQDFRSFHSLFYKASLGSTVPLLAALGCVPVRLQPLRASARRGDTPLVYYRLSHAAAVLCCAAGFVVLLLRARVVFSAVVERDTRGNVSQRRFSLWLALSYIDMRCSVEYLKVGRDTHGQGRQPKGERRFCSVVFPDQNRLFAVSFSVTKTE